MLRKITGGFAVKKFEDSTPAKLTVVLKEQNRSQFAQVDIEVDVASPHRVTRFFIRPIATPAEFLSVEERAAIELNPARRKALIEGIARELHLHYVFADGATKMIAALSDHDERGNYDSLTDAMIFASTVTQHLREVSQDLHIRVHFGRAQPERQSESHEQFLENLRAHNFGFGTVERLSGNVALLTIYGFVPNHAAIHEPIGAIMSQVADADGLLIDLRKNGGGDPNTVAEVASYFFEPTPIHLNDIVRRDNGSTEQIWTRKTLQGTRFGRHKPIYVLTSKDTFSGGEDLAYTLQALSRALVVGERTGGGAHPVERYQLDEWFHIFVPIAYSLNPITKSNWEGVGVAPDVAVPAERALDEAHRLVLAELGKNEPRLRRARVGP